MPDRSEAETHSLPGIYEHYLAKALASMVAPDPRVEIAPDGSMIEGARRQAYFIDLDRLEAGLPVSIPKWVLGGHSWPQAKRWKEFRDPEVTAYRMYPDDRLEPIQGDEDYIDPAPVVPMRRNGMRRFNL